ncbi:uncharacterized protein LOC109863535 [Pseudomyrmex gracilis]|uniref:uncharacterized protein LOC109863535 n=1 Tax=Pseudomyrmex gracilis TaxID=219809 RepID=UPI0009951A8E|nr:uncharacterized protein LOC109863535 [Pseudomyrmex gracilis]
MVGTVVPKPLWSTLVGNYVYSTPEIKAQPQYLAAYQQMHAPYYVYNIHPNMAGISTVYGKPGVSHIPAYNIYYGTPIYDFRLPLSPFYPMLSPGLPSRPVLPPTSTQEPPYNEDDYDGIEKLDAKVDPDKETKKPENISEQDDDSITVEAL